MSRRKVSQRSLRNTILYAIIFLVGIFSLVLVTGNIGINTRRTNTQAKESAKEISNQIVFNYETYLNSMFDSISYLEVGLMNVSSMDSAKEMISIIKDSRGDIVNIILCDIDGAIILQTGLTIALPKETIKNQFDSPSMYSFSSPYMIDGEYKILIGKRIMHSYTGTMEYGILLVEFNFQSLVNISKKTNLGDEGALYILDSSYGMIYSMQNGTSPVVRDAHLTAIKNLIIGTERMRVAGKTYMVYSQTLTNTGWKLAICTNISSSARSQLLYNIAMLVMAVFSIGIAILFATLIANRVTTPLGALEESMKKLESGDITIVSSIDEKHSQIEIVRLNENFNQMIKQIRRLMDEVVAEQEAQRKSELKALQNQINPHFLYNTLDSIVFMAESNQVAEVKTMVVALAKFFRISISKGKPVITVAEELEHAKNYMIIESIRYKDTFTFSIDCAKDCYDLPAMKLMLQPFVENSIYHGLKNLEDDGFIGIKVYKDLEFLYFVIEDNGYGIRQSRIDELYERMHNKEVTDSVGIKNVYQRLKLYFGPKADIIIESELDEYTRFIIKTPLKEGE